MGHLPDARESPWDVYYYDPLIVVDGRLEYVGLPPRYDHGRQAHAVVIAEKGERSTWHRNPVQFQYRSGGAVTDVYARSAMRFASSGRPLLAFDGAVPPQHPQYKPCGVVDESVR